MQTQELQTLNKEAQRTILKSICDNPALSVEDQALLLKNKINKVTQNEITQVIYSISPNKNWYRASFEETQEEILEYVWTLENQVLFLLPPKQKETTIAEFNQIRLQNKQSKVPKDIVRHLLANLGVDGKNLAKFRKLQKELLIQNDVDSETQASWLCRILFMNLRVENISNTNDIMHCITNEFTEKFPSFSEKISKSLKRICERFVEKYYPKNASESKIKNLTSKFQNIYNTYKNISELETLEQKDTKDHNDLIDNVVKQLKEVQEIINETHEGGFLSKLFSGKVKNREGVIKKIDTVIGTLSEITELNSKANKIIGDKSLLVQKLQSDYENILLVKNQLEHDLYAGKERFETYEEKINEHERELKEKNIELEKSHERIFALQEKANQVPELESRSALLREELFAAKNIALSLHSRVVKIKADLLKQHIDVKVKNNNKHHELKSNNGQHLINQNIENSQAVSQTEPTTAIQTQ